MGKIRASFRPLFHFLVMCSISIRQHVTMSASTLIAFKEYVFFERSKMEKANFLPQMRRHRLTDPLGPCLAVGGRDCSCLQERNGPYK